MLSEPDQAPKPPLRPINSWKKLRFRRDYAGNPPTASSESSKNPGRSHRPQVIKKNSRDSRRPSARLYNSSLKGAQSKKDNQLANFRVFLRDKESKYQIKDSNLTIAVKVLQEVAPVPPYVRAFLLHAATLRITAL